MNKHKCRRCDHEWQSRVEEPQSCPRCKSYIWNKGENMKEAINQTITSAHSDGVRVAIKMIRDYKDSLPIEDILKTLEDLANSRDGIAEKA